MGEIWNVPSVIDNGFTVAFLAYMMWLFYGVSNRVFRWADMKISNFGKKSPEQIEELNEEEANIDCEVNNILYDILSEFQADKIMVLQFHNWKYYNSWQHSKFISATHELPNIWIEPKIMDFKNIPSAFFSQSNWPLMEGKDVVEFPKVYEEKEEDLKRKLLRQLYKNMGFMSYYAFALRTREGQLIWKVTVVWIKKEVIFTEIQVNAIRAHTWKIESLLNSNRM